MFATASVHFSSERLDWEDVEGALSPIGFGESGTEFWEETEVWVQNDRSVLEEAGEEISP